MEKPNVKDYQYSDGEMRDLVAYTEALEDYVKHLETKDKNLTISDVVERVSRMKDDSGREGCTYGDTDYDSMTVVYGYNLAIEDVTDTLSKL